MSKKLNIKGVLFYIIVTNLIGLASRFLSGRTQLYSQLHLPPLAPPGWVFSVVWSVLFTLIGIAAYIVSQSTIAEKETALNLYFFQLFINSLWSVLFFRFQLFWISAIWILLILALVTLTTLVFYKINKTAGLLFIPYLLWLCFACYLNVGICILN